MTLELKTTKIEKNDCNLSFTELKTTKKNDYLQFELYISRETGERERARLCVTLRSAREQ